MKTIRATQSRAGLRQSSGFTMVEIALCLAIVSIALVALLGVLPTGLTVQKNNRDDTIILQEGTYLLEAIRGGARLQPQMTNYVEYINIGVTNVSIKNWFKTDKFTNSDDIIGLLSTPKYTILNGRYTTNTVSGKFRAVSGNVSEKGRTTNAQAFAFSYLVNSDVIPYSAYPWQLTNWNVSGLTVDEKNTRSNRWLHAYNLSNTLYEVRLTLRWPVRPDGTVGLNSQTFRTLATGTLRSQVSPQSPLPPYYFFMSSQYGY